MLKHVRLFETKSTKRPKSERSNERPSGELNDPTIVRHAPRAETDLAFVDKFSVDHIHRSGAFILSSAAMAAARFGRNTVGMFLKRSGR